MRCWLLSLTMLGSHACNQGPWWFLDLFLKLEWKEIVLTHASEFYERLFLVVLKFLIFVLTCDDFERPLQSVPWSFQTQCQLQEHVAAQVHHQIKAVAKLLTAICYQCNNKCWSLIYKPYVASLSWPPHFKTCLCLPTSTPFAKLTSRIFLFKVHIHFPLHEATFRYFNLD